MRENSGRGRHAIHVVVLQYGDPSATGAGGPGDRFVNEYPTYQYRLTDPALQLVVRHPRGTLAMANAGPGTNVSTRTAIFLGAEVGGTVEDSTARLLPSAL